jgi:hypothetical protein
LRECVRDLESVREREREKEGVRRKGGKNLVKILGSIITFRNYSYITLILYLLCLLIRPLY